MYKLDILAKRESKVVNNCGLDKVKITKDTKDDLEKRARRAFGDMYDYAISGPGVLLTQKFKEQWEDISIDLAGSLYMKNELGGWIGGSPSTHGLGEREIYVCYSKLVIKDP